MGVTVFKFDFPGSSEKFVEKVNEWMTITKEGGRYKIKEPEEGTILRIQRGRGLMTAPIVFEFKVGSVLGLATEMLAKGYVKMGGLGGAKQDIKTDAKLGAIPRRNGWKDMLKLLDHVGVLNFEHKFKP
ncbi:MAG: hypothetical protein PVG65_05000 [Candidatus Thorarchaeota archaeon]|jgi:hypothetical protein